MQEAQHFMCGTISHFFSSDDYVYNCDPSKGTALVCNYETFATCWYIRIDPSGTIEDTDGNPVGGATVNLLRSDSALGPFRAPPSGSPIMAPSINPETSDANGVFHWDVFSGFYQVTATKTGCSAPGDSSQPIVSTATLPVPPPQVGLVLTLACPDEAPPAIPVVTGLSDSAGPAGGGTQVNVQGSGFTGSASVSFGGTPASAVAVLSPTDILATAPAGSGSVDVQVTTPGGTSGTSAADVFAYVGAASVSGVVPAQGPPTGGTSVEIAGSGFAAGDQVEFGPADAASVTVASASEILAVAPPGTGTVDVTVINADGPSGTSFADQYTYLSAPTCAAAPSITTQPSNQTVTAPAAATFTAAGSTPANCAAPTVQWSSEAPGANSFTRISGATSASYTTPATTTDRWNLELIDIL